MPIKTFIVEDSPLILENLSATLEETAPVQVVGSAADEDEARAGLDLLDSAVDLVIVDLFLRHGSGLGVLLHAARRGLAAPRVVLTNYDTPEMRERCYALGAARVFDKSSELDELIAYCQRMAPGAGAACR